MKRFSENIFKLITKLKILKDRSVGWVSMFNLFMLASMYFKDYSGLTIFGLNNWQVIIIGFVGIITLTFIDYKFLIPLEQEFYLKINPEWNKKMNKKK